jgi:G3E family GTPase
MRLTILGGFLGSGKSTWLRHHLHHGLLRDALVVVNEAADVPVDDALLIGSTGLRVLAGGCACCETRQPSWRCSATFATIGWEGTRPRRELTTSCSKPADSRILAA